MEPAIIIVVVISAAIVLPLIWLIASYNRFARVRQHIRESWSDIDVELKRRYDLIPNLVNTVQGYAQHEREVLERIITLRDRAAENHGPAAEQAKDESALMMSMKQLFAVVERYPQLKADSNFLALQQELGNTEDRIAASRRFFNGNVREMNQLCQMFPTSLIAGKLVRGIDLREHGSRNLGATNVYRVLGWKVAVPVALVDIAKGAIPVLFFAPRVSSSLSVALLMGVAAILGHVFSVFVGFKGGKGVATGAGVMLALVPKALGISAVVWALLVWLTGYVSVASITGALLLPVSVLLLYPDRRELLWLTVVIALAITWFHRANIRRLMNGTENRFGRRGAPNAGG